jgi:hypothetical protein
MLDQRKLFEFLYQCIGSAIEKSGTGEEGKPLVKSGVCKLREN